MYSARGRAELKQLRYLDSSLGTATCCDWSSDRLNCFLGVDDITLSIGLGNAEATLLRQRLQYSTTKKKVASLELQPRRGPPNQKLKF